MRKAIEWMFVITGCAAVAAAQDGLLVVAHGARAGGWNEKVVRMMEKVEWSGPKDIGFLTPQTPDQELAAAAGRLDRAGVKRIVVVPFLVSSFSDHYEEIRYYTGDRATAPEHYTHEPLKTRAQLVLTSAMDSDRLLGIILSDQARVTSKDPKNESVMLVAHGPNDDADDAKWLACLRVLAAMVQSADGYRRVDAATIRDDAPEDVKKAAVETLRKRVAAYASDSVVLIQPVLISSGHVQAEIAKLLKGLEFRMSGSGVSTHPLAPEWIRSQAGLRLRLSEHQAKTR